MTISYDLAKQLKDRGFPQHEDSVATGEQDEFSYKRLSHRDSGHHVIWDFSISDATEPHEDNGKPRGTVYFRKEYLESEEGRRLTVYIPTLSELIEAVGESFAMTGGEERQGNEKWLAQRYGKDKERHTAYGSTPSEAVANLWLSLQKK